uniref:Transcription factor protein n=2 Tax=Ciona intestinalis TaxID=7719 RepID=Q4H3V4_CIOIN|nr:transcription factor protein [Ciona intestinalis]BAE06323.1 transcription factor protein [Ciona intestinalis]|eukprot:NP_001071661.1 transcription factor protein [Ciona intestinalis]
MEKSAVIVTLAQEQPTDYIPEHCDVQPQYVYESNIHSNNVLATLNEQRRSGLLCDMTVIVEGVELQAHKAVLAACSSYFNGIITDPANVSHNIVLELSSISRLGMESLLEFAYTSKLTVSRGNINHVLAAARELDVKNLEYSCLNLLKQKLFQETSDPTAVAQCADGSKACKNSTISRKVVMASKTTDPCSEGTECCVETKNPYTSTCEDDVKNSKGDCPLMAKLSLNSKPTSSDVKPSTATPIPDIKPITSVLPPGAETINLSSLPKAQQQMMLQHFLQQQNYRLPCTKTVPSCDQPSYNSQQIRYPTKVPYDPSSYDRPMCTISYSQSSHVNKCGSNYNSDTDEALSADDDSERSFYMQGKCAGNYSSENCGKLRKQSDVVLPFSINEITKLPRTQLQELLNRNPSLSPQQITAIHEIRRRGKNRIAAQRCRKRKMDCIRSLQCQLEQLREEHLNLMGERRTCQDKSLKLAEMFQKRYEQVFSDFKLCKQSSETSEACPETENSDSAPGDHIVASMADYFKMESDNARELAERFCKLPCSTLPPFSLCSVMSQSCPMMSSPCSMMSQQDVVVVCDGEDSVADMCAKPCSPSGCSTNSYTSELTEPHPEVTTVQEGAEKAPSLQGVTHNPPTSPKKMDVDTPRVYVTKETEFRPT